MQFVHLPPIRSAFGRSTWELIRLYLWFFPLLCIEKLNYLGEVFPVLPLAGSWFKLNPSVLLFPLPMLHISPVTFPSRCLCRAPWDVQVPSSQLGCSGTASAPSHCIPEAKRGENNPGTASKQFLSGIKGRVYSDLITMLAVRERNQLESTAVWE